MISSFEKSVLDVLWVAAQMREAQDNYFRSRDRSWLVTAKQAEANFDNMVGAVLAEARKRGWRAPDADAQN